MPSTHSSPPSIKVIGVGTKQGICEEEDFKLIKFNTWQEAKKFPIKCKAQVGEEKNGWCGDMVGATFGGYICQLMISWTMFTTSYLIFFIFGKFVYLFVLD